MSAPLYDRSDGEHWTVRGAEHALGDAAHDQVAEPGASVGGHHDPVDPLGGRGLKNLLVGRAHNDLAHDLYRCTRTLWEKAGQLPSCRRLHVVTQRH
jgi:hypothetical protein